MSMDVTNVGQKVNGTGVKNLTDKSAALKQATDWLGIVRKGAETGDVKLEIDNIRENLEKAGKFAQDIGTSEKELNALQAKGYKNEAVKWVKLAKERSGTGDVSFEVEQVRKFAIKSNLSLSDADALKAVGTSDTELKSLVENGNEKEALKWLNLAKVRSSTQKVDKEIDYFFDYAAKTDKPLNYFKTSIDDIAQLDQKASDNASMSGFMRGIKQAPVLGFVVNSLFY
jgi:hypothetical protein